MPGPTLEQELALTTTTEAMIRASRAVGRTRAATRAMMIHPKHEGHLPAILFDDFWPEDESDV